MGDLVTITTTGRATADVELKTSTNGKNTKYVQFGLAVNKGYGEHERPNFFSCVLYGEAAQRLTDAGVKKEVLSPLPGISNLRPLKEMTEVRGGVPKSHCMTGGMPTPVNPKTRRRTHPNRMHPVFPVPMTVVRKDYRLVPNALNKSEELQS